MAELDYTNDLHGIGDHIDRTSPLTTLKGFELLRPGFTFDDAEDFALLASHQAAIAAKNVFVIDEIVKQESIKVEDNKFTGQRGQIVLLRQGIRGTKFTVKVNADQARVLASYSELNFDMVKFDLNNNLIGVKNEDLTIGGFSLVTFIVDSPLDASETEPVLIDIVVQEDDPGEYIEKMWYQKPTWRVSKLKPLTLVTFTASTVASFIFTLTAKFNYVTHGKEDGTVKSVPWSGAVKGDIVLRKANGTIDTVVSMVETAVKGVYTVTGTAVTTGTVQSNPSATNMFESNLLALTV